jgi:phosphinothricin acetyltransferase
MPYYESRSADKFAALLGDATVPLLATRPPFWQEMSMAVAIRLATQQDAAAVQGIYAPIVRDTVISFEVQPPSVAEMQQRIVDTLLRWPWLVCEHDGEVLGYAYAGRYRVRAAYQWSVDVSVYVHERARRRGIGRALYRALLRSLVVQGFYNAQAGITLPNVGSVSLHESLGFQPIGVYRKIGYKLGAWHDVGWWQLVLQLHATTPAPPRELPAVQRSAAWEAALAAGTSLLRL